MITFGSPLALAWLLALLPAAGAAWYAARRRQVGDAAFGGPPALRRGRSGRRRGAQAVLLLAALVPAALAAARPQWGDGEQIVTRRGIDVAIALDVSRSMTATDIEPSRAQAAAADLQEMLTHLRGDRVGLVTFAGSAFERSPLTLDLNAVAQLIARAQSDAPLVRRGTDIGGALERALRLLDVEDAATTQAIVLISDGEDLGGVLDAALLIAGERGVRIYTVAAGTEQGGALPSAGGDVSDEGDGAVSRADRGTLRAIAQATGGNARELDSLAGLAVEFQRLRQSEFEVDEERAPIERFQWFAGAALALLGLQWLIAEGGRAVPLPRGRIALGAGALLVLAIVAACGSDEYRRVERGNDAYARGVYEEALAEYRAAAARSPGAPVLQYNIGNALHRLARYEEATVATADALGGAEDIDLLQRATYAAGSHAFRRGDLEAARQAFIGVLLRDPADADAKHNLEVVLRRLSGDDAGSDGEPDATPTPDDGDGDGEPDAGATPDAGDGDPSEDGEPSGDGNPSDEGEPGEGDPAGDGSGEDGDSPQGAPRPETVEDARSQLSEALLALGDEELSFDDALGILDLVRVTSELEGLLPGEGGPTGAADR